MVAYLGLLVQFCCGEGEILQTNIAGMCGECLQCKDHTGCAKLKVACVSWVYTAQAPGFSAGVLSKEDLPLQALPRSKLLRFLGTPKGHRLIWACVLCLSQVQAAQATRYSVSTLSQVGHVS